MNKPFDLDRSEDGVRYHLNEDGILIIFNYIFHFKSILWAKKCR